MNVIYKSETEIKKPMKFSAIIQWLGIFGFLFCIVNFYLSWGVSNWAFAISAVFYFGGMLMGIKLTHQKSIDTPNSLS